MTFRHFDKWANGPENRREADSTREAVAIKQTNGETVVMGNEVSGEWIKTEDMGPVSLEECR